MRNPFRKPKKTMSDANHANAGAEPMQPMEALPLDANDEQAGDVLSAASQAAAEHMAHDSDGGGRSDVDELTAALDAARAEIFTLKDQHVRLLAEFDNVRKRTARERLELMQFAGENVLKNLLPVLDDMERAIASNDRTDDVAVVKEGFHLIRTKLLHILGAQGVKPMDDSKGQPFDTDRHEAITKAAAPSADLKGKVIDVVENGYTLHDKVIRYAKVVVGE